MMMQKWEGRRGGRHRHPPQEEKEEGYHITGKSLYKNENGANKKATKITILRRRTTRGCKSFLYSRLLFVSFVFSLLLLILRCSWYYSKPISKAAEAVEDSSSITKEIPKIDIGGAAQAIDGTHVIWDDDIEAVYALPPPIERRRIEGMVILFHACTHTALKFFAPNGNCPDCVGLSEENRIVRLVLERGYAALAVTCRNKRTGCWSPTNNGDLPRIDRAIERFLQDIVTAVNNSTAVTIPTAGRGAIRIIAIGASSGGTMAAKVVAEGKASAALVMVMGLPAQLEQALIRRATTNRIALYLAPMPRDKGTLHRTETNYQALTSTSRGVPVVLDTESCVPLAVTAEYLYGRIPGMTRRSAAAIVDSLTNAGHLASGGDGKETNGVGGNSYVMLVKDPTKSNWRHVLQSIENPEMAHDRDGNHEILLHQSSNDGSFRKDEEYLWGKFLLTPGKSPLAKALHRAWAFHEYCSEVVGPAISFFEDTLPSQ